MPTSDVLGLSLWTFVGAMQLMFGITWLAAARLSDPMRHALRDMAWFNLLMSAELLLVGQRDTDAYFLTHTVSNLLQLAGFALLWRAGAGLTGAPASAGEQRLLLLVCGGSVLLLGLSPATEQARVAVCFLGSAWVLVRAGGQAASQLRQGGALGLALAIQISMAVAVTALVTRALAGLVLGNEVDLRYRGGVALVWALLAPIFAVNMIAAYQAFGRVLHDVNRLSRLDNLTGLADATTLEGVLTQEYRRLRQWGSPVVLMELGVDQLGTVRESFGAQTADAVLAELSWKLKVCLRAGDVLAHCGDGVFRVVLPGTGRTAALALAQELLAKVGNDGGLHPESGQRLTLSIGLAEADADDSGPQAVLRRAQAQTQCARLVGGDRVAAESVVLQPQPVHGWSATVS